MHSCIFMLFILQPSVAPLVLTGALARAHLELAERAKRASSLEQAGRRM